MTSALGALPGEASGSDGGGDGMAEGGGLGGGGCSGGTGGGLGRGGLGGGGLGDHTMQEPSSTLASESKLNASGARQPRKAVWQQSLHGTLASAA